MNVEDFESTLDKMQANLLELARDITWNKISNNCKFILSEIKYDNTSSHEEQKNRRLENSNKRAIDFSQVVTALYELYYGLYDVIFYIYKSTKNRTLIEVCYYLKSAPEDGFELNEKDLQPMFHSKVSLPTYLQDKSKKFDINWEHQEIRTKWKLYWARKKFKNEMRKMGS